MSLGMSLLGVSHGYDQWYDQWAHAVLCRARV